MVVAELLSQACDLARRAVTAIVTPSRARSAPWHPDPPPAPDAEQGSITLMLAAMFVGLLALFGIVVDGGTKLDAAQNADAVAQEAARAGAGRVSQSAAYATGQFLVDQQQAVAAARAYLAGGGYTGTVVPQGRASIRVTVTITKPTQVLSLIGISSVSATGSAVASLEAGVTGPGA
jgi:Flp pilus assembly protein TadG